MRRIFHGPDHQPSLLFSQHSFIPFAFWLHHCSTDFTLTHNTASSFSVDWGESTLQQEKKAGKEKERRKNYVLPLSLSVVIEFLNIFSKIA